MSCTARSVQSSHELRIHSSLGCSTHHTSVIRKGRAAYFVNVDVSSHGSRQEAWDLHLLSRGSRPVIRPVRRVRCNVSFCRSVLTPGGGNEISALKSAALVWTRSYNALRGSPLMLKLIPAFGIIAFAAWGIGPLMRMGRIFILQKSNESDDSWTRSGTHYVMTSYLRALLLWTGATLICRALNPMVLPSVTSQAVKQRLLNFVQSLSTVLAFSYCLSSLIQQAQKFFVEASDSNDPRNMGFSFAGKAVYTAVWVAAVSLFMELLGFSTQRWVTAGGLGTVLLTLAGREIFTNFLSSVMIHATRPFVVNEWIQTKIEGYEVSGTVEHVGWWSPTIIRGDDREAVHIPNHKFTVNVVRNLSQKTHWRIKTHFAISHLDVHKINNIVADMRKVLAKNPQVEQQRLHRRIFLENVNPENQALTILVSCFVKTSHFEEYLCVKEAILLDLLRVISHHRARLATPIRTVQKIYSEADLENVPFADTIFTRSRTAANRPLLLIEPSYKISGDDKSTASSRSAHMNEEKDVKAETASASESKSEVKAGSAPTINSKKDRITPTPISSGTSSKVSASESRLSDNLTQKNSETQEYSSMAGNLRREAVGVNSEDPNLRRATSEKSLPATDQDSGRGRSDTPGISQAKLDIEKSIASSSTARPALEENIVLGVALEGSKRTLPMEEDMAPSPLPAESKELAGRRNGGGSPIGKDKKEGQMPTVPGNSQME